MNPPNEQSTIGQLRESWLRHWAAGADKVRYFRPAYDAYAGRRDQPRGQEFYSLTFWLAHIAVAKVVWGERCLAMLGTPDLWKTNAEGSTLFVYYYTEEPGSRHMKALVLLDPDGRVLKVGWNVAGLTDDVALGFHR